MTYRAQFEPYVVIRRTDSPSYDERFLQRFYNKVSHIYALYIRKYVIVSHIYALYIRKYVIVTHLRALFLQVRVRHLNCGVLLYPANEY